METTRDLVTGIGIQHRDAAPADRPQGKATRTSKTQKILYFGSTGLLVLFMAMGGVGEFLRTADAIAVIRLLGYPDYFSSILGAAKLLGAFALVAPVPRVLREWAYAGFVFDVAAASVSILAVAGLTPGILVPVLCLAFILTSYVGWRKRVAAADEAT